MNQNQETHYIYVTAHPSSKKESVKELGQEKFAIYVKQPAENGLANKRIQEIIAEEYGVPTNTVKLIKGGLQPKKLFSIQQKSA